MKHIAEGIWKIRLGEPEKLTPAQFFDINTSQNEMLKNLPFVGEIPFLEKDFKFAVTTRGCTVEHLLEVDEKIYGFGLQLKSFNQRGKKKILRTNSDPVADTGDSHAPVPFYVSTRGYGILVDTARYAGFYCGTHVKVNKRVETSEYKTDFIANNPSDLYALKKSSQEKGMMIEIPSAQGVDIYIFAGPTLKNAVQRYNLFSGGGCLPPHWGLGVWYRTCGSATQDQAAKLAQGLRESHMPCDVYGLEPGWHSHAYACSYQWHPERFPQPNAFIEALKDMHFQINLWEHVFVHPSAEFYGRIGKLSGDLEVWGGLVPDLSLEAASQLFAEYHQKKLVDKGISGFKLDECDSSDFCGSPWSFPDYSQFPSGLDGEQMHSLLGILYQKTLLSVFREKNQRTYCQVRSSHAFAAQYPFVLYSDLYDHRDFIRGVVNMGFTGLLWSPEVRQCDSVEELIRRIQSVVFSPQALVNAWMIPNPPWKQYDFDKNMKGEFLDNVIDVEEQCRKLFQLRMSLIPYLYSAFSRYRYEGIPPFRALVMDYPEDDHVFDMDDAYMMGDSLLIAPVIAGNKGRKIYLPIGGWYCFWTHKRYEGGQTYEFEVELDKIPVFVKENSLIPLANPIEYITPDTCFELTIYAFGEECRGFVLFEDDGYSYDFENGKFNLIELTFNRGKGYSKKTGSYAGCKHRITAWKAIP